MRDPSPLSWLAAATPVVLLFGLVLLQRVGTHTAALIVAVVAAAIAAGRFEAGLDVLGPAVGKGAWLGLWIGYVVAPALLLYRLATVAGVDRIRSVVAALGRTDTERLLVVAWLLPSLIQGIAGFGAPIALTAPLLLSLGYGTVRAVSYPLIGYCWSVTFGSMASSFYTASVTAQLSPAASGELAVRAAVILAVLAVACGATLCVLHGGPRCLLRTAPFLLVVGVPLGLALVAVAWLMPAMATVASAGTGIAVTAALAAVRRRRERGVPAPDADGGGARLAALAPYLALVAVALPVFLVPASGDWVRGHLLLSLDFPATETGLGWSNPALAGYTPIALLGHPGSYILLACVVGYLTYRRAGLWGDHRLRDVLLPWVRSLPRAITPIVALTIVAAVLIDSGMTATVAAGLVGVLGGLYPVAAPAIGAVGSFTTGSTTSSNALLSSLQAESATLLELPPAALLAGQTAGGNVGNAVAPVVVAVGAMAVDATDRVSAILRRTLPPALVLLALVTVLVVASVRVG